MPKIHRSNSFLSSALVILLTSLFVCGIAHAQTAEEAMDGADADTSSAENSTDAAETMLSARYLCELQGLTRRVEVDYESTQYSIPCSVNYYKDTEAPGEVNTLWNATNIEGYCEEKAAGFVAKLKSWGWSCTEG